LHVENLSIRAAHKEDKMAQKTNFTADEWKMILGSPMLAGMAVTLAEPSGLWGIMQEGMASGQALLDVKRDAGASELAKALVAEMETSDGRSAARDGLKTELTGKSPAEMRQRIIATLTRVGQVLDAKAPDDAAGFKAWLKHITEKVAEASTEGGFLGFGRVTVSDAEKASIREVSKALGV
jgi:hypothetical protein